MAYKYVGVTGFYSVFSGWS